MRKIDPCDETMKCSAEDCWSTIRTLPAHAGSEQKLNRFWRGIGTTDRPISAAAQKATAKGSTMTLQTILDPERAAVADGVRFAGVVGAIAELADKDAQKALSRS